MPSTLHACQSLASSATPCFAKSAAGLYSRTSRRQLGERRVQLGVVRIGGERALPDRLEPRLVVREILDRRRDGERALADRIRPCSARSMSTCAPA